MGLDWDYSAGQTPLEEEERAGLRIPTIATKYELDEFEQQNIEEALLWVAGRSLQPKTIFTEQFVKAFTNGCTGMCGNRQGISEEPKKTWVLTGGKYRLL